MSYKILVHQEVWEDIKKCQKKWYKSLWQELPRLCRLLAHDGVLPGFSPVRGLSRELYGKILHARINLPKENIGKRKGARIIFMQKNNKIKIIYVGGHKDKRYDDANLLVELIVERLNNKNFTEYKKF